LPNLTINVFEGGPVNNQNKDYSLLDLLDAVFMKLQVFLMKVRYGSEILKKDFIHFIKKDHSVDILGNYEKIKS